ncbi:MAG: bifunctional riboflavin kinase/FAD synthetase [Gemmatimonadaceae bacterium]|nr:bifunctional riboflavin kinase/FAD synthetase [Gemmatimonadaceae bacterium]
MPADPSGLPSLARGSVVTVGTFDGVHLGHRHVLDRLAVRSRECGLPSVLVTFDPHPLEIVRPDAAPPLLTLPHERLELLATTPVDYVFVLRFTSAVARLTAEQFVDEVLLRRLSMRELLIGHDHGFGRGRAGDVTTLQELGASRDFVVDVVQAVAGPGGRAVSSSAIRNAIAAGDLATASGGLGRRYSVSARVVSGARRGRLLGYPTINITPPPRKLLPGHGVYAIRAETPKGAFGGMLNHGPRPTFDDPHITLEAHLFNADVDLYGSSVRLEFVSRLRDVRRFDSADALAAQLAVDERHARDALGALTQTL